MLPAQRGRKGGDADEQAPRRSERGREWESADRGALPRSERGRACRLSVAEQAAPLGRALAAAAGVRGWEVGPPTAQGQGASAGESWAKVWAGPNLV